MQRDEEAQVNNAAMESNPNDFSYEQDHTMHNLNAGNGAAMQIPSEENQEGREDRRGKRKK